MNSEIHIKGTSKRLYVQSLPPSTVNKHANEISKGTDLLHIFFMFSPFSTDSGGGVLLLPKMLCSVFLPVKGEHGMRRPQINQVLY